MKTSRVAISYRRFSCALQAGGDSENRQERDFLRFCERHKLIPSNETFSDRGLSGYHGTHRAKGELGRLEHLARDGHIKAGTVLVIEAWDRLGRQRPDKTISLIADLLRAGLSIGVCRLDDLFTEEDLGSHKFTTLSVFVQLAFQESKQKSERIGATWEVRRAKARAGGDLMTGRLPAWLEFVNGAAVVNPEKAATVKRIFTLAGSGYGHTRIVKALTDEGVPAFGQRAVSEGRGRSQFSGVWNRPYVKLILNDKRVLGEFQPCGADRKPIGQAIKGYYPAVVTEAEYLLARAGAESRRNRGPVSRQRSYVNVFQGILRDARNGEGWVLHNKGTAAAPQLILASAAGNGGRGRTYTFPYPLFESAVLSMLKEVSPDELNGGGTGLGETRLDVLRAKAAHLDGQIEEVSADLKAKYSRAVADILRQHEAAREEAEKEIEEEQAKAVTSPSRDWRAYLSLAGALDAAEDPDVVRLQIRAVLRRRVESIHVLIVKRGRLLLSAAQVFFHGGALRSYLIAYRAAANHSPRQESWRSLPCDVSLDLRRPADVKKLEAHLTKLLPSLKSKPAEAVR